jgi:hypothetical protein
MIMNPIVIAGDLGDAIMGILALVFLVVLPAIQKLMEKAKESAEGKSPPPRPGGDEDEDAAWGLPRYEPVEVDDFSMSAPQPSRPSTLERDDVQEWLRNQSADTGQTPAEAMQAAVAKASSRLKERRAEVESVPGAGEGMSDAERSLRKVQRQEAKSRTRVAQRKGRSSSWFRTRGDVRRALISRELISPPLAKRRGR